MSNLGQALNKDTEQYILNKSFDTDFDVLAVETMEEDPNGTLVRKTTDNLATKWEVSGSYIYVGDATIGSVGTSSVWRVQRINTSTGEIEWADSGAFTQQWSNRGSLTYA